MAGKETIRKILVRAPNWIGDAVMCLPAVDALKRLYPEASVAVLTRPTALQVFEFNPSVDSLIEYHNRGEHKGVRGRVVLATELKRRGFDLAVLFQNAFDAALLARMAGIPERVGYSRDFRTVLLTRPVAVTDDIKKVHQVFYYLNIVAALGGTTPSRPLPKLYLGDGERSWAEGFVKARGLAGATLVGAAPGASYGPAKRWPPERFAAVLNRIASEYGAVPVVCGGHDDRDACTEVARRLEGRHLNLAGETNLREFIALLHGMGLFVTNDSGPMHLAAAAGVPTVAVFGSTDPAATGPLGRLTAVVREDVECSPCFERECAPGHYDCLNRVTADAVFDAASRLLRDAGAGAS
jgi:heptosyltransferase-2